MIEAVKRSIVTRNYFLKKKLPKSSFIKKFIFIAVLSVIFDACKPSSEQLFTAYFEPYNSPGTFRSEGRTSLDTDFILALARYDEEQYGEAAQYLTKTLAKNPEKDVAVLLRGVSYLAIDSLAMAKVDLRAVVEDTESLFVEQGKWYLGLLYLRQGDKDSARLVLKELKDMEKVKTLILQMGK